MEETTSPDLFTDGMITLKDSQRIKYENVE
jgi:hypothetical protein